MRTPIRIDHANSKAANTTVVDWNLGNRCNYACSYCPSNLHDGSAPWPDPIVAGRFVRHVASHCRRFGRDVFFQFTGGEPTLYPHLVTLLDEVRAAGGRTGLISNGSRTLQFWDGLAERIDQIVLTHHIEFARRDHFIEVVELLNRRIKTHVNVTMLPERFDECIAAAAAIAERCSGITLTRKPLLVGFGAELYSYTKDQQGVLNEVPSNPHPPRFVDPIRGYMRRSFSDGTAEEVKATRFVLEGANRWAGWTCWAGVELLAVTSEGDVYRGTCRQGGRIGTISDPSLELPSCTVLCERAACHCLTDIMTTRAAPPA